jgi:flagellar hook-associated protein 1 FlgK
MLSSAEVLTAASISWPADERPVRSVNGEIANDGTAVNLYAALIGQVNEQITKAQAASGQPPNDLLDMRDQLVAELNTHIKVKPVEDSVGNFNVFNGNASSWCRQSGKYTGSRELPPAIRSVSFVALERAVGTLQKLCRKI